jgi:transcriptional regulator with XRE-family HTH domain
MVDVTAGQVGIGVRLKTARETRGVSMAALAKRAGCARSTLFNVELETHVPSLPVIQRIAAALDIDPGWLAFGIGASPLASPLGTSPVAADDPTREDES